MPEQTRSLEDSQAMSLREIKSLRAEFGMWKWFIPVLVGLIVTVIQLVASKT